MDMVSDHPERRHLEAKEIVYSKGKTMLPVLLISLCLAMVALSMLLWIPASVSYKNITSLSELNEEKVRFYTENQHIHLVYGFGEKHDTIRSVADYVYSVKKENLREEAIRTAEYLASEEAKNSFEKISEPLIAEEIGTFSSGPQEEKGYRNMSLESVANGNFRSNLDIQQEAAIEPDAKPEFPKGERGLEVYLARNKQTPYPAKSKNITGDVLLRFLVNTNGSLSDIRIVKGLGYGCDEEAFRLVKNMPLWKPARKNNQPVNYYEDLRIRF